MILFFFFQETQRLDDRYRELYGMRCAYKHRVRRVEEGLRTVFLASNSFEFVDQVTDQCGRFVFVSLLHLK